MFITVIGMVITHQTHEAEYGHPWKHFYIVKMKVYMHDPDCHCYPSCAPNYLTLFYCCVILLANHVYSLWWWCSRHLVLRATVPVLCLLVMYLYRSVGLDLKVCQTLHNRLMGLSWKQWRNWARWALMKMLRGASTLGEYFIFFYLWQLLVVHFKSMLCCLKNPPNFLISTCYHWLLPFIYFIQMVFISRGAQKWWVIVLC